MMRLLILVALLSAGGWLYYRLIYFHRDPERSIPEGNNIVAPADGTIVYVHLVEDGQLPISVKEGKRIQLGEITKTSMPAGRLWHVGIFMSPYDVHINRTPVAGEVQFKKHYKHQNLSMRGMETRRMLRFRPLYKDALHITENERNTILIDGDLPVWVVQIADEYVNKIDCWIGEGDTVHKGQRFGRIVTGSQVDLIFPDREGIRIVVEEGQHVKAGESIVAWYQLA